MKQFKNTQHMLDLKFKSMQLVTSYLGHEHASTLIV